MSAGGTATAAATATVAVAVPVTVTVTAGGNGGRRRGGDGWRLAAAIAVFAFGLIATSSRAFAQDAITGGQSGSATLGSDTASGSDGSAAVSTGSATGSTTGSAGGDQPSAAPAPAPSAVSRQPPAATATATATATGAGADAGTGPDYQIPVPRTKAEATHAAKASSLFAIKVIGGLIGLMVLAYLGGHRRVVRFQERLGISGVITAGFPFVALGAIAAQSSIGILTPDVINRLRPVLHFGLGWIGFIIGAQLDIRVLERVPKGTAYMILVEALGPFGITAAGCGVLIIAFHSNSLQLGNAAFWRDMVLLGTAAAMTAPRKFRGFASHAWHEGRGADVLLAQLDEIVGVIGLIFITSYFRDPAVGTWQLPNTAWMFVSLGLGVAIGVLIFAMIRVPVSNAEFLAVVLGAIAFASGLAGYLRLSPIAICFLAGVLVKNFPNDQRDSVFRILAHLERPVQLLFLIIAGALWKVTDWRGWALVPLFVAGRILGKWTGLLASKTVVGALLPTNFASQRQLITPLSSLSIALVISLESLYGDPGLPWIITAVIGGSIVTEILVSRSSAGDAAPVHAKLQDLEREPIDELDDLGTDRHEADGPIYRDEPSAPHRGGPR